MRNAYTVLYCKKMCISRPMWFKDQLYTLGDRHIFAH